MYINPYPINCCLPRTSTNGCPIRLPGECVYYSGATIVGFNIITGDNFNIALNKISNYVNNLPTSITASNGLSKVGNDTQLGQLVSQSGNPALLTSPREIPMGGNFLCFTGGNVIAGKNTNSGQTLQVFGTTRFTGVYGTNNIDRNIDLLANGSILLSAFAGIQTAIDGTETPLMFRQRLRGEGTLNTTVTSQIYNSTVATFVGGFWNQTGNSTFNCPVTIQRAIATMSIQTETHTSAGTMAQNVTGFYAGLKISFQQAAGVASTYENFSDLLVGVGEVIGSGMTLTNRRAIHIGSMKQALVTNAYAIYQEGVSDINYFNGVASFGNIAPASSARVQIDSNTRGFLPPRMTTVQKNAIVSPVAGLMVYDTTLNKLCVYTTAWETITSV